MTTERRRTLLLLVATFIMGILIGALAASLISKEIARRPGGWRKEGKEAFVQKILSVVEADSAQAKKIRPHILETIARIDTLQKQTGSQVETWVDSLEIKLQPFISEKQINQLREFHRRGRNQRDN